MATVADLRRPLAGGGRVLVSTLLAALLVATGCSVGSDELAIKPTTGSSSGTSVENDPTGDIDTSGTESADSAGGGHAVDEGDEGTGTRAPPADPPSDLPRPLTTADVDCAAPDNTTSLTSAGQPMFDRHLDAGAAVPVYQLAVDVNPATGAVVGAMRATVPAQERTINFRVFPGMEAFESGLQVRNVTLNGELVDTELDRALLAIPAAPTDDQGTVVELDFEFTIDQMAANENLFGALSGETLQPDQVGLLGRTDTGMQLGHWFPVWLPDGIRTDPDPSGFGDIGAFPAANICATITVPSGYEVVTGGSRVATTDTSIVEAGAGLRDFSILISNDLALAARVVEGVEIRVWGPSSDPGSLITVLDYAEQSHESLTDAFGPYPWEEIDIISAPLGGGVGGMEWPGAIWIEQNMFAGGLPGLGGLGALFGDDEFGSILGSVGGEALTTSLEWTIAHELGHEWWHATVGNDSIESPAVDEPLAQFSACIAMQRIHPENWRDICEAQTIEQYAQARSLGVADTAAEQASDEFESSLQYGAVVYGKAPGFYFAAADLLGWDVLTDALRAFVAENSFDLVSTDTLRSHLVKAAGDDGQQVAALWDRWFRQAKGDEDIEASDLLGGLGGLGSLEGLELENFDAEGLDLEGLDLENLDLEELLEGLDLEGLNLDELLQEFLEATGED